MDQSNWLITDSRLYLTFKPFSGSKNFVDQTLVCTIEFKGILYLYINLRLEAYK